MANLDATKYAVTCEHCSRETNFLISAVPGLDDDINEELADAEEGTRRDVEAEFAAHIDPAATEWRHMFEIGSAIRRQDLDAVTERLRTMCATLGGNLLDELERGLVTTVPLFDGRRAA
jgi:hypothetical protein